jgi:hypothetical protein
MLGWDSIGLFVYEVTNSKIKELAEYPINEVRSVIVLDQ